MPNSQTYNEKELLLRIAGDDAEAFAAVFKQYFHHLYVQMLKYTNRHADAEDIVQQIFVQVWEKRQGLVEIERFDKWLFTMALNEFRMRFRKLRVSEQYKQYLVEVFEEAYGSPDEILIFKQHETIIRQAIDGLPAKQRQAFLLSREEGLTYTEISGEMGVESTTVKEHISRALKTLRSAVAQHRGDLLVLYISSFFNLLSSCFSFHASFL